MRRAGGAVVLAVLLVAAALGGCDSDDGGSGSQAKTTPQSVRVVAQNILHGFACPADSDRCRLPQRVQLFGRQLTENKCPQVVTLTETDPVIGDLLHDLVPTICAGKYRVVGAGDPGLDRELMLTTLAVLGQERTRLAGPLRDALWVRLRAPLGPLDVVATHLASSSDDRPCDSSTCRPPCKTSDTLNTCQGRQAAELLRDRATPESVGVLMGDLNAKPNEPTIRAIEAYGLTDTFAAAENTECDPATGSHCTSGRNDADLSDLTNPAARQQERIDYVFLLTKRDCKVGAPTGLFAEAPASPPLDGLVFASDHTGVEAAITCATSSDDLAAAKRVAGGSSTTTTKAAAAVSGATAAAVTKAFSTVFDGGGSVDTRLGALQDADQLRESLIARYTDPSIKTIADQIRSRIDSMQGVDADHVDVTYSILLGPAAVLDHLPGQAVRQDGKWLVSRGTYCQVASLGVSTVPEPCR